MAHIAFVAVTFLGHVNPMVALARAMTQRGHRVTFLHMADAREFFDRDGFTFVPIGQASHPPGRLGEMKARYGKVRGILGGVRILKDVASTTDMLCAELPTAIRRIGGSTIRSSTLAA